MREIEDRELLRHYLGLYGIEAVFSEPLLSRMSLYGFDQGEQICSQGETLQDMYLLVKGKLKVYTTSVEGRSLIHSFRMPLEVIGDIEYVQEHEVLNTVEAVSAVLMLGIPYRALKQFGGNHAPLLQFLLKNITRKYFSRSRSMDLNVMYPVEVRVASYLLAVSFDETDAQFKGKLSTDTLTDVANLVGTSYRHLNRVIRQLSLDNLIERRNGFIVVKDKDGLSARANHNLYRIGE